jgi:hypothetical protein
MAGPSDQQPPETSITPVPDLIEQYRLRRDAWIAQADELARLRDEVRSSAEREAMEIVTTARRDVRKVVMEARRELLVLSAQVQAALGETTIKTDPNTLLSKAGITLEPGPLSLLSGSPTEIFAPEDAVNEILSEVQDDMTALAEDARVLPLQVVPPVRQIATPSPSPFPSPASAPQPAAPVPRPPLTVVAPPPAVVPPPEHVPPTFSFPSEVDDFPALEESASKTLLSSQFPSDAVPVQSGRNVSAFVALFVGIGVIVGGVTIWWLSNRNSAQDVAPEIVSGAAPAPAQPPSEAESADAVSTSPVAPAELGDLSVVAEAVRDVWVRTTVDGRTDGGRMLVAGEVIDVSAERSISLRVGDAGAIVVSVNRGEKRPLGDDGQVLTRDFVVKGADVRQRAPATPPATAKPAPSAVRSPSPIASAAPAIASPAVPAPTTPPFAGVGLNLPPPPSPPSPAAPAPPPPSQPSQLAANGPQPTVPSGIVNQLSAPAAASPAAAAAPASPATAVVATARQWLDAYHRQDRAAMSALSTENLLLADERRADERFPPGLNDVTRTLDRVSVQIAADTAVLTAVMLEQSGSAASPHVSPISQVWVLGGGQWKVRQARFVSEARLNQVFR